jgi:hypothetical protein
VGQDRHGFDRWHIYQEGDPDAGTIPPPGLLLHWRRGAIMSPSIRGLKKTPEWAKPIVARALQLQRLAS